MFPSLRINKKRGVTLTEILIVIVVGGILFALTLGGFQNYRSKQAVEISARDISTHILQARAKTLASENDSRYGINFASTTITLFSGAIFQPLSSSNINYPLDSFIEISSLTLSGGATSTIFDRITGATTQSGSITLRSKKNQSHTKIIIIEKTGLVRIQ